MATATASLKNYRQAPRKVRLVADALRGKHVARAIDTLNFTTKRASHPMKKLLESAIANARQKNMSVEDLTVKEIRVDAGLVMKRLMPRARGRGAQILKRTSHVMITVSDDVATKAGSSHKAETKSHNKKEDQEQTSA